VRSFQYASAMSLVARLAGLLVCLSWLTMGVGNSGQSVKRLSATSKQNAFNSNDAAACRSDAFEVSTVLERLCCRWPVTTLEVRLSIRRCQK